MTRDIRWKVTITYPTEPTVKTTEHEATSKAAIESAKRYAKGLGWTETPTTAFAERLDRQLVQPADER